MANPYTKSHRCSRRERNQEADESHTENSLLVRRRTTRGKKRESGGLGEDIRLTGLPHTADVVAY